jgi:hypothetical protein
MPEVGKVMQEENPNGKAEENQDAPFLPYSWTNPFSCLDA